MGRYADSLSLSLSLSVCWFLVLSRVVVANGAVGHESADKRGRWGKTKLPQDRSRGRMMVGKRRQRLASRRREQAGQREGWLAWSMELAKSQSQGGMQKKLAAAGCCAAADVACVACAVSGAARRAADRAATSHWQQPTRAKQGGQQLREEGRGTADRACMHAGCPPLTYGFAGEVENLLEGSWARQGWLVRAQKRSLVCTKQAAQQASERRRGVVSSGELGLEKVAR